MGQQLPLTPRSNDAPLSIPHPAIIRAFIRPQGELFEARALPRQLPVFKQGPEDSFM